MTSDSSDFNPARIGQYVMLPDGTVRLAETREEWCLAMESDLHIADDYLGVVRVSTVFLGLDRSYGGKVPVLFETAVFLDGEPAHEFTVHYPTYALAYEGHTKVLKAMQQTRAVMRSISPDAQ